MFGSNTIQPSLYQNLLSQGGNSTFTMIENAPAQPKTRTGGYHCPPIPGLTLVAPEQTFSTTTTVVGDGTLPPTLPGSLPPTSSDTVVDETQSTSLSEEPETPKEPCISFEKDFDPNANMHDLARRLVQDRLNLGLDHSELLIEALVLRKKAQDRRFLEQKGPDDGPLAGIWTVVPDVRSDEYCFYTAIILTLEHNPVVSTTRKGTRSLFEAKLSTIGHDCCTM
ncbi:hypothetical protein SMACR_01227 [Sordaria macrospora]|uniref:WGS project CABT00000000 data, contig 2.4 n=2 Tax=Sordaria macrospora TaxID=5147 RepID=F7VQ77_SORMK|nr:uncharacterized protein SMAC_01227 [Sordaria macrospora k-hell]KAA8630400.1 hypothetical protein SMACR_01227 [Sordaria macrospora]WPJ58894.1 hypothetical protein SMAC4_01227 [Sordaria macrospora]CCC07659.1 unnamed protein product [Sordaria macrospora k-hell]